MQAINAKTSKEDIQALHLAEIEGQEAKRQHRRDPLHIQITTSAIICGLDTTQKKKLWYHQHQKYRHHRPTATFGHQEQNQYPGTISQLPLLLPQGKNERNKTKNTTNENVEVNDPEYASSGYLLFHRRIGTFIVGAHLPRKWQLDAGKGMLRQLFLIVEGTDLFG